MKGSEDPDAQCGEKGDLIGQFQNRSEQAEVETRVIRSYEVQNHEAGA